MTDHGTKLHLVKEPPFLDSKNRYIISFFISGSVNHLLLVVNSSMNFLIYCCMAKRFRKALLDVFRSWRCHWSGGSILQCWMPFDDLSKMDVNRYNWKIPTFPPLSVQTTKTCIRRFMKARLWVHFGRALRLASTKILHPRRFQTTPGRFSKQSWGVRPWWRESPYSISTNKS